MTRVVKKPDERKEEIIETALSLFCEKGYSNTSISDVVKKVGVAQGTFYYYFESKEKIIDVIIDEYFNAIIKMIIPVIEDENLCALDKIKKILQEEFCFIDNGKIGDRVMRLHLIEELSVQQKLLTYHVAKYAPLIVKIINQGIKEGVIKTDYPLESIEIFLVGFHFLFDAGIITSSEADYKRRIDALGHILENIFQAEKGSFDFFPQLFKNTIRKFYESKKNNIKA
jgi:AcrR family transcriptional regulator